MTNGAGETKQAGALVDASWLGGNVEALERAGWVQPVKRKPVKPVTTIETKEPDNG